MWRHQGSPNQAKWATSSPWFQWSRPISVKKRSFSRLSVFSSPYLFHQYSYFFFNIHIKGAPMFLKCDPYRVWCSIFYSKLVNCTLLDHCSFLWKVEEHAVAGKETFKIWIDFRKSPRFSFTSSLSQEREKSSRPVFTMCGEPCITLTNVFQYQGY